MTFRSGATLLALLALAAPAYAHADPAEKVYDPLAFDLPGYLGSGTLGRAPPPREALPFASYNPGSAAIPLEFSAASAESFAPVGGLNVQVSLAALAPVVAQDASGNSLRIQMLADGVALPGMDRTLSIGQAALVPNTYLNLTARFTGEGVGFLHRAKLTLRLTPQMPALAQNALAVLVGEDGSRADFPGARLQGIADLGIQEPPGVQLHLLNETLALPVGQPLVALSVTQNGTTILAPLASGPVTWVVLRGDHSVAEGRAYHEEATPEARNAAAQVFRVGQTRVRVHPGLATLVAINITQNQVVDIACESCAQSFRVVLPPLAPGSTFIPPTYDPADVLIPPPRATAGIPVSADAPPEIRTPGVGMGLAVLATLAALGFLQLVQRRR